MGAVRVGPNTWSVLNSTAILTITEKGTSHITHEPGILPPASMNRVSTDGLDSHGLKIAAREGVK